MYDINPPLKISKRDKQIRDRGTTETERERELTILDYERWDSIWKNKLP